MAILMRVYLLNLLSSIDLYVCPSISNICLDHCSYVTTLEIRQVIPPTLFSFLKIILFIYLFVFPYEFWNNLVYTCKEKPCWDFDRN